MFKPMRHLLGLYEC